ncbi:exopolysaccharide biosynthesis polyprenyl glycosylphosphotransferase [Candidatus Gracilibacteria bacterium]|nr:exopolysaccharide biosynthesis polyprenyl glycosylphosphotransferase [Candidatus Gracilibacteria bacterium]
MKKYEILLSIIKIPLDFAVIFFSFFIAREIRLITDLIPGIILPTQTINDYSLVKFALFGSLLYIIILASHKLYQIKMSNSKIKEVLELIRYGFYAFIFFSVFAYLGKGFIYEKHEIPRLIVLYTFIIGTIINIIIRIILNKIQNYLLDKKIIPKTKILLINNKKEKDIKEIIDDIENAHIYKIVGYLNKTDKKLTKIKYIGNNENLENILNGIDEILFIDSDFTNDELFQIWEYCKIFGIRYRYITNLFDLTKLNTELTLINNIPVIDIKNISIDNWGRVIKRFIDILGSIAGIIIFGPLMIFVGFMIKLEDPSGPIIYKNKRIGQKGKEFYLFKFRYLNWKYCVKDSYGISPEKDKALEYEKKLIEERSTRNGPLYKIKNDPRKTKIGNFIEKYSIDELPQFFNVLIGNMSLVGPRPHQPREVANYELSQKRVLTIKPGITGMAQVNGRETNSFDDEVKYDIFYIENWNFLLDLKIVFKTFGSILKR